MVFARNMSSLQDDYLCQIILKSYDAGLSLKVGHEYVFNIRLQRLYTKLTFVL